MYRSYENPNSLEKRLDDLKKELDHAIQNNGDDAYIDDLAIEIQEMEERINFAWQDDEEDEEEDCGYYYNPYTGAMEKDHIVGYHGSYPIYYSDTLPSCGY